MCEECREMLLDVPAKDWLVTRLVDRGRGHYYRYHVEGQNLNWPAGHRERPFSWDVPDLCERYDLSLLAS